MKNLNSKKMRRIIKRKVKRYLKPVSIVAVVVMALVLLQHRDIAPTDTTVDNNIYEIENAILSGQEQVIIGVPETVTSLEEAVSYYTKLDAEAMSLTSTGAYSPLLDGFSVAYYEEGYIRVTFKSNEASVKRLNELYDQETENVRALAGDSFDTLSEKEKFCLIVKYVKNHYRYGEQEDGSRYGMEESITESKKMVCNGYGALISAICQRLDIDCIVMVSEKHIWNAVRFEDDDFYTIVDLTSNPLGYSGVVTYYIRVLIGDYKAYCNMVTLRPAGISDFMDQIIINIKY